MLKMRKVPEEFVGASLLIVGMATCPYCKKDDVAVVNDHGSTGNPESHYLENHEKEKGDSILCPGSEAFLSELSEAKDWRVITGTGSSDFQIV